MRSTSSSKSRSAASRSNTRWTRTPARWWSTGFSIPRCAIPGNYGFIPHTLSHDGDPCDVLVANTRAIVPGAVMSVRPVGVLLMEDEAGGDEKIIAVPSSKLTQRYDKVKTYSDLPEITLQQIQHFFEHYKDLEPGKWVKVLRWGGPEEAHRLILEGIARAKK